MSLFSDCGVHAITVHPRFSGEKLKRRARWRSPLDRRATRIPLYRNGDVCSPLDVSRSQVAFAPLSGLMLGRIVAVKPGSSGSSAACRGCPST